VYVSAGTFIMEDGEISLNSAGRGGGVVTHSNFTMRGGMIWGNTAVGNGIFTGGGVAAWNLNSFRMEGGFIYGSDWPDVSRSNTPDTVDVGDHFTNGAYAYWPAGTRGYVGIGFTQALTGSITTYVGGQNIPVSLTVRATTP
jgi:hypothetical protein